MILFNSTCNLDLFQIVETRCFAPYSKKKRRNALRLYMIVYVLCGEGSRLG